MNFDALCHGKMNLSLTMKKTRLQMSEEEKKSRHQEWDEFVTQQKHVDGLVENLEKDLNLAKKQAVKALVDWVYMNSEADFLKLAAEKDAGDSAYGGELEEFVLAAIKAWQEEWHGTSKLSANNVFDVIQAVIYAYEDCNNVGQK